MAANATKKSLFKRNKDGGMDKSVLFFSFSPTHSSSLMFFASFRSVHYHTLPLLQPLLLLLLTIGIGSIP